MQINRVQLTERVDFLQKSGKNLQLNKQQGQIKPGRKSQVQYQLRKLVPHDDKGDLSFVNFKQEDSGLWRRCDFCARLIYNRDIKDNLGVCPECGGHLLMNPADRIASLTDPGTWRSFLSNISPIDPLNFEDSKSYTERLKAAQSKTGMQDATITGSGLIENIPVCMSVMCFHFMGGSMGSVVGEKITRLIEYATYSGVPLVIVSASGGARMQEGILSLMQMAKISGALHVYQSQTKSIYLSLCTSPTTGGVTASFAMLGDLILSEPKALIAFAGRRVIEQTISVQAPDKQVKMSDSFQAAEAWMERGLLDLIIHRHDLKGAIAELLEFHLGARPSNWKWRENRSITEATWA